MISFEEAFDIVMDSGLRTGSETLPFNNSYGRVLDEDIKSDIDMPPFNRSAVDGYACHLSDLNSGLELVEVIAAGRAPSKPVKKYQCSKIMTGAIVPEGCDVVFMVEESEKLDSGEIRFTGITPKRNISLKGEDVRKGDLVLKKSRIIRPQDIAVMASVGHTEVLVKRKPLVGIISTGDELIDPSEKPEISKIRNSNAFQLEAQVERAGADGINYGIAPDNETVTFGLITRAINQCEIVLITGGVSMGDFDFVPSVLQQAGVEILFNRVNVQPGKPTTFGLHRKAAVFGLPGNPVSTFVQFELLVRPLINLMMSYKWKPVEYNLPMAVSWKRKSSDRLAFIPVTINNDMKVVPVDFHGSAHIAALSSSDGIISVQPGIRSVKKGEIVNVRQI